MAPLGSHTQTPWPTRTDCSSFLDFNTGFRCDRRKGHCACAVSFLPGSFVHSKAVEALFLRLDQTPWQGRWVSLPSVEGLRGVAWFPAGERSEFRSEARVAGGFPCHHVFRRLLSFPLQCAVLKTKTVRSCSCSESGVHSVLVCVGGSLCVPSGKSLGMFINFWYQVKSRGGELRALCV